MMDSGERRVTTDSSPAIPERVLRGANMIRDEVAVRWPQGGTEAFKDVAANQLIVAREGKGIVETHPLRSAPSAAPQR